MKTMRTEFNPETPVVVSLQGHSGSGKSYIATLLEEKYGWDKVSFARLLRDMGLKALGTLEPHDPKMMRFIATASKQMTLEHPFLITKYGIDFVSSSVRDGKNVVIDDLRMMSEWWSLKSMSLNGEINWFPILVLRSDIKTEPRNQLDTTLLHLPSIVMVNPGDVQEDDPQHVLNQLVDVFRTRPCYGQTP
jgi:hypothetical protein